MTGRQGSPMYNSMWQLRRDRWSTLEGTSAPLIAQGVDSERASSYVESARDPVPRRKVSCTMARLISRTERANLPKSPEASSLCTSWNRRLPGKAQ